MGKGGQDEVSELAIADYALLSDCRSAALVSRAGSVDWLCFPRFDSPSVFARLLDTDAGHFAVRPAGLTRASRRYLDQTMVLETTFRTSTGTLVLVDAMALGPDDHGHRLGAGSPGALLRRLHCTNGQVTVEVTYAPRPEYGLVHPLLAQVDGGLVSRGGADVLALSAPVPLELDGSTATAKITMHAGQRAAFALNHARRWEPPPPLWDQNEIAERFDDTIGGWRSWSAMHQTYEGPWRELVHHSGRVLQALTFQPTGAIVAAPTTSLPETVGGQRNWDYRRCGSATAPGPSASSTSMASCWAPPSGCSSSSANWTRRPRASWWRRPTPPRPAGRTRIRASGRSAARPATSCIPS